MLFKVPGFAGNHQQMRYQRAAGLENSGPQVALEEPTGVVKRP
jgi:hypothetical protein